MNSIKAIELKKKIKEELSDKKRVIIKERLIDTCLIGKAEKTCRYIFRSNEGYVCAKNSLIQLSIDEFVKNKKMVASGDNCNGLITREETSDGKE